MDSQVFLLLNIHFCLVAEGILLQNISDIAELGLDNPEIFENLLNALEEMGGDDEDSEVSF